MAGVGGETPGSRFSFSCSLLATEQALFTPTPTPALKALVPCSGVGGKHTSLAQLCPLRARVSP